MSEASGVIPAKAGIQSRESLEGWQFLPIKDFANTTSGGTPKRGVAEYYNGDVPWVKSGDLNDSHLNKVDEYITQLGLEKSSAKLFKPGTLLIALYGATIGRLSILNFEASTNQAVCGITVPENVDVKYLFYYLLSIRQKLIDQGKGGAQPNINQQIVKETVVPLAPPEQQKRIVAKIEELFSHIDAGIEALKKAKQLLKQYRQSVLKAAVTGELTKEWRKANKAKLEPASQLLQRILKERRQKWEEQQLEKFKAKGKMPKNDKWKEKYKEPYRIDPAELEIADGWVLASWDQISNWVTYGFTRPMPHVEEGIPIVTGKNVIESKIKLENAHKTPKDNYESLSEKDRPKAGDLLITKDGTIGRAAVVPEGLEFCINQSVAVIWLRSCPISRKYLLALIESDLIQKPIMAKARGVAIQHLSITDFAKLPVPIPSLKEQDEIIVELNEKLELIARTEITIEQQLAKAEKNKQSILASAYSGRLADEND